MAWIVYELINEDRKEIFIGLTEKDVGAELELDRAVPPDPIRHWDFARERVRANARQRDLTRHEARELVREYRPQDGWIVRRAL